MPYYESVIIARQDLSASQVENLSNELTEVLQSRGGKVTKKENWGLRNLAYRMKKNRKGHYVLLNIDAPADAMNEYERLMRINEDVLRYMSLRVKELDNSPSVVVSSEKEAKIVESEEFETENTEEGEE